MSNSYTFVWNVTDVSLTLTSVSLGTGTVIINTAPGPGTYNSSLINLDGQYPVTIIATSVFNSNNTLTSITMNNVTALTGNYHFYECRNLVTINLPLCTNALTFSFAFLDKLSTLNMPSLTVISGGGVFENPSLPNIPNTSLTSFNFPNLITITNTSNFVNLFNNWTGVTTINLGNLGSVTTSGGAIFNQFPGLTSINIPSTLTTLPTKLFTNSVNLNTVTASGITSIQLNSITFTQPNSKIYFGGSPPSGSGIAVSGAGTLTVYRNTNASGWSDFFLGFPVLTTSFITSVTTPTTSLSASGNPTLSNTQTASSYQWKRNGTNIAGATSATYTIVPTTDLNQSITLSVTDPFTGTSTSQPYIPTKLINGALLDIFSFK